VSAEPVGPATQPPKAVAGLALHVRPGRRLAFVVMVESLRRPGVFGVLVPSLHHFSRFPEVHQAMCAPIELETGVRVVVMDHPREERHDAPVRTTDAGGSGMR
jgi:hypothetical protein